MSVAHWWNDAEGQTQVLAEDPVTVPLCPPQISHGLKPGPRDDSRRLTDRLSQAKAPENIRVWTQISTGRLTNTNRNVSVIRHCVETVQSGT